MPVRENEGWEEYYRSAPAAEVVLFRLGDTKLGFKPVTPKVWSLAPVQKRLRDALDEVGKLGVELYKRTVVGWEYAPKFRVDTSDLTAEKMTVRVTGAGSQPIPGEKGEDGTTAEDIYNYVDQGTRPHVITAKIKTTLDAAEEYGTVLVGAGQPMLVFRRDYFPRTQPGSLGSGPSSESGPFVQKPEVHHPGIMPRGFSRTIEKLLRTALVARAQEAIKQGVKDIDKNAEGD